MAQSVGARDNSDNLTFVMLSTLGFTCAVFTSPFFAAILLVLILCCFPTASGDVELRLAVDAEVRRMQEELNDTGTAAISMFGRGLLWLKLMFVFVDFAGDIFSVVTFVAKGHVWFGVFLALIVLRSFVDLVKLQRETGLVKEVQLSLRANTLTNRLCDVLRAEKTVEGTLSSVLLVYGMFHNFNSPVLFAVTLVKYVLSVFSVAQGSFIVFHLASGESERASLLSAIPLGRRAMDSE